MLGFQFAAALYLQRVLGYEPTATGLAMLPIAATIAVVSLTASGRLVARFGARRVLLAGEGLLVVGLLLLTRTATDYATDVLPALLLLAAGQPEASALAGGYHLAFAASAAAVAAAAIVTLVVVRDR